MQERIDAFMAEVAKSNANEPEFLQAVQEVAETVIPFIEKTPSMLMENFLSEWSSLSVRSCFE